MHANSTKSPAAIRVDLAAIFVSLELSRSKWLVTSLAPGGGEKMSRHIVPGRRRSGFARSFCRAAKKGGSANRAELSCHINPGGTFCLEYGSEDRLGDVDAANRWWSSLESFLHNQEYAAKRGEWPLAAGLSHGQAALEQLAMEEIAKPLGWTDELLGGMFRGRGWLARNLPRVTRTLDRVVNARTPCPRGCTWKHKSLRKNSCELDSCETGCRKLHKPVLRANCPNRRIIEEIVLREHRRRAIEAAIAADLKKQKAQCCGSMKNCPIRKDIVG